MASKKVTGFISFSDVLSDETASQLQAVASSLSSSSTLSPSLSSSSSTSLSPMYTGPDQDLNLATKRVVKKDITTRLKGFQDMYVVLQSRGMEVIPQFLPHFFFLYTRYFLDDSPKVRVQFNWIFYNIVSILVAADKDSERSGGVKKNIALLTEFIPHIIAYWWFSICDHSNNESSVLSSLTLPLNSVTNGNISGETPKANSEAFIFAKRAFELTFPLKQRAQVLFRFSPNILTFLEKNMQQNIDNIGNYFGGSSSDLSKEYAEERLDRIISVSLNSLLVMMRFFQTTKSEFNAKLSEGVSKSGQDQNIADRQGLPQTTSTSSNLIGYRDIINSSFWKKISNKFQKIRESAYDLSSYVFEFMPHLVFSSTQATLPGTGTAAEDFSESGAVSLSGGGRKNGNGDVDSTEVARRLTSVIVTSLSNESCEANMTKCIQNIIHFMKFLKRRYDQDFSNKIGSPDPVVTNSCNLIFDGIHAFAAKVLNNSSSALVASGANDGTAANLEIDLLKLQSIIDQMLLIFSVLPNINIYFSTSQSSQNPEANNVGSDSGSQELKISVMAEKVFALVELVHQHYKEKGFSSGFSSSARDLQVHNLSMILESCTYLLLQKTSVVNFDDVGSTNSVDSQPPALDAAAVSNNSKSSKKNKNNNSFNSIGSSGSNNIAMLSAITCFNFKSRVLSIISDVSASIVGFLVDHSNTKVNAPSAAESSLFDLLNLKRPSRDGILIEMLSNHTFMNNSSSANDLDICLRSLGQLNRFSIAPISSPVSTTSSHSHSSLIDGDKSSSSSLSSASSSIQFFWRNFNSFLSRKISATLQSIGYITTQNFGKFVSSINTITCLLNEIVDRSSANDNSSKSMAFDFSIVSSNGIGGSIMEMNQLCFDLCQKMLSKTRATNEGGSALDLVSDFSLYQSVMVLLHTSLQLKYLYFSFAKDSIKFDQSNNISRLLFFESNFFIDFFAFIDRNSIFSESQVINLRLLNKVIDIALTHSLESTMTASGNDALLERLIFISCNSYSGQLFICKLISLRFPDYFIRNSSILNSVHSSRNDETIESSLPRSFSLIMETCDYLLSAIFDIKDIKFSNNISSPLANDICLNANNSSRNISNFDAATDFVLTCFQLLHQSVWFTKKNKFLDISRISNEDINVIFSELLESGSTLSDKSGDGNRRKINKKWLILSSFQRLRNFSKTIEIDEVQLSEIVCSSLLHLMFEVDFFKEKNEDELSSPTSAISCGLVCNMDRLKLFMFSHTFCDNLAELVMSKLVFIINNRFLVAEPESSATPRVTFSYSYAETLNIFDKFLDIFEQELKSENKSDTFSFNSLISFDNYSKKVVKAGISKFVFLSSDFWSDLLDSLTDGIFGLDAVSSSSNSSSSSSHLSPVIDRVLEIILFFGGLLSINQKTGYLEECLYQNCNIVIFSLFISKIIGKLINSLRNCKDVNLIYSKCLKLIGYEGGLSSLRSDSKYYSDFMRALFYVSKTVMLRKNRIINKISSGKSTREEPGFDEAVFDECITAVMMDIANVFELPKDNSGGNSASNSSNIQWIPKVDERQIHKGMQVGYLKSTPVDHDAIDDEDVASFGDFMLIRVRDYYFQPASVRDIHKESDPYYYTIHLRNNDGVQEIQTVASRLYHLSNSSSCREVIYEVAKLSDNSTESESELEPKADKIVFVYGSLRRGLENFSHLRGATYLGIASTKDKFHLTGLKNLQYPFLSRECIDEENGCPAHVIGELYRIDSETLERLDILEGYKENSSPNENEYSRVFINVVTFDGKENLEVLCYLLENESSIADMKSKFDKNFVSVPRGDWRDFKRHYEYENSAGLEDLFDFYCDFDRFFNSSCAALATLSSSSPSLSSALKGRCSYISPIIQVLNKKIFLDETNTKIPRGPIEYDTLQTLNSCYQHLLHKLSDWLLPRLSGLNYGTISTISSASGDSNYEGRDELMVFAMLLKILNAFMSNLEAYSLNSSNISLYLLCEKVQKLSSTFFSCLVDHNLSMLPNLHSKAPTLLINEIVFELLNFCTQCIERISVGPIVSSPSSPDQDSSVAPEPSEIAFEFAFIALSSIHTSLAANRETENGERIASSSSSSSSVITEGITASFIKCCIALWEKMDTSKSSIATVSSLDWQLFTLSWSIEEVISYFDKSFESNTSNNVKLALSVILTTLKCKQFKLVEEYFLMNLLDEKKVMDIIFSTNDLSLSYEKSLLQSIKFALSCFIDCCFSFDDSKYLSKNLPKKIRKPKRSNDAGATGGGGGGSIGNGGGNSVEDVELLRIVLGDQLFKAFYSYETGTDNQDLTGKGVHLLFMRKKAASTGISNPDQSQDDDDVVNGDGDDDTGDHIESPDNSDCVSISEHDSIMRYFLVYMVSIRKIDFMMRMFDRDVDGLDQAILTSICGADYLEQRPNACVRDTLFSFLKTKGFFSKLVENCLKKNSFLLGRSSSNVPTLLTEICSHILVDVNSGYQRKLSGARSRVGGSKVNFAVDDLLSLGSFLLLRVTLFCPLLVRNIYSSNLSRNLKALLSNFIESKLRFSIMEHEMSLIDNYISSAESHSSGVSRYNEKNPSENDSNPFVVRTNVYLGDVLAIYNHSEDSKLSIKISFPASYPLANVTVDFPNKIGMREEKFNKWKLQILILCNNITNSYNKESASTSPSGVLNACIWWKTNLEKEFEGIEPCPICYSIIHISSNSNNTKNSGASSSSLPSMQCHTCNNKFHSQCLKQWFQSSGKSKCVICQQPFFT